MKLSTRLVLLILGCLLPILTGQIYSQVQLYKHRHEQISGMVLRQAELANAEISSVVGDVRQLGIVAEQLTGSGNSCAQRLTAVRQRLGQYRFLALFSPLSGALLCASNDLPAGLTDSHPEWLTDLLNTTDLAVGQMVSDSAGKDRFLPIAVRLDGGDDPRVLVTAISTEWLAAQLDAGDTGHAPGGPQGRLIVADRNGAILRFPDAVEGDRRVVPDWFRPLLTRADRGVENVTDAAGRTVVAAYVPNALARGGLTVVDAVTLPDLATDIDQATYQTLLVIGGAAIVALIVAWAAGRRFIRRPSEALLLAARKWREGDFDARATVTDTGSEFAALAQSFNAMAAGLQARDMERRMQASYLESQVAERARELSETNNRLQVEIAGRERTEAVLHQAQKLQAVGQLAGGIAHDFNNMLATVLGNLELMDRRVSQAGSDWTALDCDRLLRLIERATGAVTRGSQLTTRLLAFSRRQRPAARATDINALLRELITLATSTLGRRVQVVPELADDLWQAMVDPSQMEAAILNLCLNARDAMPEGGRLTIRTANIVTGGATAGPPSDKPGNERDLPPGEYVQVCICDTGIGMSTEVKVRAFDPFFTTKAAGAGSGLGLSQVQTTVRQAGGNVSIESAPNEGTQVIMCLPRAAKIEDAIAKPAEPPVELPMTAVPKELILVVDDDYAVRQVTVEMARELGYEVVQAVGGDQALALVEELSPGPSLILLDYAMPGMNGLQLARALRQRGLKTPIAMITGYAELSEAEVAASELAGLLRKPFTIRELQGLLAQLRATIGHDEQCLEPGLAAR